MDFFKKHRRVLNPKRIRKIDGTFGFIPHRFLTGGFLASMCHYELLLYQFLILVGDKNGVSFYGDQKICTMLDLGYDDYLEARKRLAEKDLILCEDRTFQVLDLPERPRVHKSPKRLVKLIRCVGREIPKIDN